MSDNIVMHEITLDLTNPISVEAINIFGEDTSASHGIIARITDNRNTFDLSGYTAELKVERMSNTISSSSISNNTVVFNQLTNGSEYVKDGWSLASIVLKNGEKTLETQAFQIYQEHFEQRKIDIDAKAEEVLNGTELERLLTLTNDYSKINSLVSREKQLGNLANNETAIQTLIDNDDKLIELAGQSYIPYDITGVDCNVTKDNTGHNYTITPNIQTIKAKKGSADSVSKSGNVELSISDFLDGSNVVSSFGSTGTTSNATVKDGTFTIPVGELNKVEDVKLNGKSVVSNKIADMNAIEKFTLNGMNVSNGSAIRLEQGNGIIISSSDNTINIGTDINSIEIEPKNIKRGSENQIISFINGDTVPQWHDLTALGIDTSKMTYNPSFNFNFGNYEVVTTVKDEDFLPFSFTVSSKETYEHPTVYSDTATYYKDEKGTALDSGETVTKDNYTNYYIKVTDDSAIGKKITWANLLAQFARTHRTVYIPITITSDSWNNTTNVSVQLSIDDLKTKYDLTYEELVADEHNHAHIHPEPSSVVTYCNYGMYCSSIALDSNDNSLVDFNFVKNTIDVPSDVNVVIEVRIG